MTNVRQQVNVAMAELATWGAAEPVEHEGVTTYLFCGHGIPSAIREAARQLRAAMEAVERAEGALRGAHPEVAMARFAYEYNYLAPLGAQLAHAGACLGEALEVIEAGAGPEEPGN